MEWFIKANLNLAVFLLIYMLVIRFTDKHVFARGYLLVVPLASVLLPLMMFDTVLPSTIPTVYLEPFTVSVEMIEQKQAGWVSFPVLYTIYFGGVGLSLLLSLFSLVKLLWKQSGPATAYSFFNRIYIPETNGEKRAVMLLHEEAHIKQWHSLDTVWYAIVRAFFWINPVVYKLFAYLKDEHEYSADAYTIGQLGNKELYCDLLLDETFGVRGVSQLAHSFHSQTLFNRIKMITQTQPQSVAWWKRIALVPLLATLLMISITGTNTFAQKVEGKVYDSKELPEKMPEFKGGGDAMIQFLQAKIKYPQKCRDQKIEGRVVLKFIVDKEGRIRQVTNLKKDVDPLLVNEAIRVVSAMPKWNPGTNKGEAVNTEFVLPIVFHL